MAKLESAQLNVLEKKTQGEANSLNSIKVLGLGYAILQQLIKLLVFIKNEKIFVC